MPVCEIKQVVVVRTVFLCVHTVVCASVCEMKKVVSFGRLSDTIDSDRYMAN